MLSRFPSDLSFNQPSQYSQSSQRIGDSRCDEVSNSLNRQILLEKIQSLRNLLQKSQEEGHHLSEFNAQLKCEFEEKKIAVMELINPTYSSQLKLPTQINTQLKLHRRSQTRFSSNNPRISSRNLQNGYYSVLNSPNKQNQCHEDIDDIDDLSSDQILTESAIIRRQAGSIRNNAVKANHYVQNIKFNKETSSCSNLHQFKKYKIEETGREVQQRRVQKGSQVIEDIWNSTEPTRKKVSQCQFVGKRISVKQRHDKMFKKSYLS